MEFWKSFEIDDLENMKFCEMIMNQYILKKKHQESIMDNKIK